MTMMIDSATGFLLGKIDTLVTRELSLHKKTRKRINNLRNELGMLKAFLIDTDAIGSEQDRQILQECVRQIRNLVYSIEDAFDMSAFQDAQQDASWLTKRRGYHAIASALDDIETNLKHIKENMEKYKAGISSPLRASTSNVPHSPGPNSEIVGFEEPWEALVSWIRDHDQPYKVMFVVGMGGSGKTALVHLVYEQLKADFDCYVWHTASKPLKGAALLSNLRHRLCNIQKDDLTPTTSHTLELQDIKDRLKKELQDQRYLIVFDDLWSKDVWESMHHALPRNRGSRIIITTRRGDIASSYKQDYVHVHHLKPLPLEKAQEVFYRMANPRHLAPVPRKWPDDLCEKCEGLPLALTEIGKLISKRDYRYSELNRLHEDLGAELRTSTTNPGKLSSITNVLILSYNDLPYHLKCCFLYMSMFPESYLVKRRMLIRFWLAEGFITGERSKLEDIGEDYLAELQERNLIQAGELDFDGRPRTCRMHGLMHKIARGISEDEGFFSICETERSVGSDISEKIRRLSIQTNELDMSKPSFPRARTIFSPMVDLKTPKQISPGFNLLKILHLEGARLEAFPEGIVELLLLRYLCLSNTRIKKIPASIKKLKRLETLNLKQTMVTSLPRTMTNLENLQHLLVCQYNVGRPLSFNAVKGFMILPSGISKLRNLQKLSFVRADKHHKLIKQLMNLTELRKLGIIKVPRAGGPVLCRTIGALQKLQSLNVTSVNRQEVLDIQNVYPHPPFLQRLYLKGSLLKMPQWISKLHDLVRIRLKWSRLPPGNNPIIVLEGLPNLLELQLLDAYTGDQLEFDHGNFPKLKVLEFDQMAELKLIIIDRGASPCLQKLIISQCVNLKEITVGIDNLTQLKELHLIGMPPNLVNPIRRTGEKRNLVQHVEKIYSEHLLATGGWAWEDLIQHGAEAGATPRCRDC